jgi:hypothetical protein
MNTWNIKIKSGTINLGESLASVTFLQTKNKHGKPINQVLEEG